MRIAFFGGSFDPPHLGHLAVANAALQALQLDRILFAPVALQPLKPAGSSASFADRLAMTTLAIAGQPSFEISLIDAPTPGVTGLNYTFDTLSKLRHSLAPATQLFLLIGADAFRSLPHWRRAAEIPFAASLIVAARPGESLASLPAMLPPGITAHPTGNPDRFHLFNQAGQQSELTLLPNLNYEVSATQLRRQIHHPSTNQPPLLPPAVLQYIQAHHLYQNPASNH